ncbi:hypothetical protein P170DRAFT_439762 [Aspergillus steynii IBT 23096]|uniref:LYR motif-containing protein Cup1-like N-terminal domain-containing protein n=1 Tax=Aspergillus steynii IBT 23096 TaxID=1392250 RepID=A0A2I2FZM1_9EURO|nr:uncharacterized protein P170DRAFT_439762 [Aspergillus steynii IBT 23096]PLB46071.1 hypothetical protein P170DRAFT_439762 [Aspergillus steynii IBT 23096]
MPPRSLPPQWAHLCRALLRECSYLPDPLARAYHHDFIMQRFRHLCEDPRDKRHNIYRQNQLRKKAVQGLSLLHRANEGYSRPLEKVLRQAYGRKGKKRQELIDKLVHPGFPTDHMSVEEVLTRPEIFSDGWEPPRVMVNLLKAQQNAGVAAQLTLSGLKQHAPVIPETNSWGWPLSENRRRNIRKRWYYNRMSDLLPPLPDSELQILEGLISGSIPWTPPKKRKAIGVVSEVKTALSTDFLTEGPQKGETHRKHVDGRPHVITRRFMEKQWKRISCLVPRMTYDPNTQKHTFTWDTIWNVPKLAYTAKEGTDEVFEGVDKGGKLIKK